MRVLRRRWSVWAVLAASAAAAGLWWASADRPPPPEVPSPAFDAAADPAAVADVTAARAAVGKNPTSAEAWGEYGVVLRAYERHVEADACFRTAAGLDP